MDTDPIKLVVLGATGSEGRQALDVVRSFPGEFEVLGLCAGSNWELLQAQIDEFRPCYYHLSDNRVTCSGAKFADPSEIAS